jgi:hypothetical protein
MSSEPAGKPSLFSFSDDETTRFKAPSEYIGMLVVKATATIKPIKVEIVSQRVFHILR